MGSPGSVVVVVVVSVVVVTGAVVVVGSVVVMTASSPAQEAMRSTAATTPTITVGRSRTDARGTATSVAPFRNHLHTDRRRHPTAGHISDI